MEGSGAQDESQELGNFLDSGSELAGAVSATALALLVGGPPGAVAGAIAQPLATRGIRRAAVEVMRRQLSMREQMRIGAVLRLAAARIERNMNLGYEPRADGFFQGEPGNRSAAEELAEGVLISAQREHEEKKLAYLANMLANFVFEEGLNRGEANLLLRIAIRLSYRQFCLLALFGRKDEFPGLRDDDFQEMLREPAAREQEGYLELIGVLEEAEELLLTGLLAQPRRIIFAHGEGLNPSEAELNRWGGGLYELMELNEIPTDDLQPLADLLR